MIFLTFDKPFLLGAISFWNYTKHPERGAHEIAIYFDDKIIYKVRIRMIDNIMIILISLGLFKKILKREFKINQ